MFTLVIASILALPAAAHALTQTPISAADYPVGLAEDGNGNVFVADEISQKLTVVPSSTGTLFGVAVTAGVEATILSSASSYPMGLAVNAQGDVFYASSDSQLKVIARTSKTLFGVAVTAATPTVIAATWARGALDFDSIGNLFGVNIASNTVQVLPAATGTLFGVSVTANTRSVVLTQSGGWFWDLAIDAADNVLIADGWGVPGVYILPKASGSSYGQSVTQNVAAKVTIFGSDRRAGIDVDASGNVFVVQYGSAVDVYSPSGQDMFGQTIDPNTMTRLTDSQNAGVTNQGLLVAANGDLITGGGSATYRTVNYLPAPPTPPTHTLTFDANGGTGVMADQLANAATSVTANSFTRLGFTFAGWNTFPLGGGVAYQDADSYAFTQDATLYAQWTAVAETPVVAQAAASEPLASTGQDILGKLALAVIMMLAGATLYLRKRLLLT